MAWFFSLCLPEISFQRYHEFFRFKFPESSIFRVYCHFCLIGPWGDRQACVSIAVVLWLFCFWGGEKYVLCALIYHSERSAASWHKSSNWFIARYRPDRSLNIQFWSKQTIICNLKTENSFCALILILIMQRFKQPWRNTERYSGVICITKWRSKVSCFICIRYGWTSGTSD